jgi:hypothetical protein
MSLGFTYSPTRLIATVSSKMAMAPGVVAFKGRSFTSGYHAGGDTESAR